MQEHPFICYNYGNLYQNKPALYIIGQQ